MDLDFDGITLEVSQFERVWKKARKDNDRSKQAAVLLAFAIALKKTQGEVQNMAERLSSIAVSDINEEIKKG